MVQILVCFIARKRKQADDDDHLETEPAVFDVIVHLNWFTWMNEVSKLRACLNFIKLILCFFYHLKIIVLLQ